MAKFERWLACQTRCVLASLDPPNAQTSILSGLYGFSKCISGASYQILPIHSVKYLSGSKKVAIPKSISLMLLLVSRSKLSSLRSRWAIERWRRAERVC